MTQYAIAYISGKWQCYATETGIDRRNEGPRWDTPRQASDFIERLQSIPRVSPIRSQSEADSTDAVLGPAMGDARPLTVADRFPTVGREPDAQAVAPDAATPSLWGDG